MQTVLFHSDKDVVLTKGSDTINRKFQRAVQYTIVKHRVDEAGKNIFIFEVQGQNYKLTYEGADFELFGEGLQVEDVDESSLDLPVAQEKEEIKPAQVELPTETHKIFQQEPQKFPQKKKRKEFWKK